MLQLTRSTSTDISPCAIVPSQLIFHLRIWHIGCLEPRWPIHPKENLAISTLNLVAKFRWEIVPSSRGESYRDETRENVRLKESCSLSFITGKIEDMVDENEKRDMYVHF